MYIALQEVAGSNARVRQLRSNTGKCSKRDAGASAAASTAQTRSRAK